ncbi:fluoride efflux transporter FluC [Mycetocola miduiensis]|uniref:Fluoride-specific ion channel FluC n=1 Tax=Mycetocola miduiensis TaxID=995034 RepID=A0A1I4YXT6_9MICO|nr:CrcB family protein [Mycetocola miduiensis]SFN42767.1 CrcB protein [Mycetocola miduiensis]
MSDVSPARAVRPPHLRPALIGLVLLGGSLGTAAREGLVLAVPSLGSFPLVIFLINVGGAFALGGLLGSIVDRGSRANRALSIRLFAGTGFLGGFTTYSALATGTDLLLRNGDVAAGILYAGGSLVLGLAAAAAGLAIAGSSRGREDAA